MNCTPLYTMQDSYHDFQRKISHIITNDIVGDTLFYNNNMQFTTLDKDNDLDSTNCATHWRLGKVVQCLFHRQPQWRVHRFWENRL